MMNVKMSGNKIIFNLLWRFAERSGAQFVTFFVSIILARILEPSVYGIVALVTVFITILNVFVDSGLGNSLIQKKDADDLDFSSVFYANIVFCLVLYTLLFFAAPIIAKFYSMSGLTAVVRVMGLIIVISGVKNVQQAYVSRNMMFKRFFYSTLVGTIGAAIIGIVMAYMGFGVWALVGQYLFNAVVDTCVLWFTVEWKPKLCFSWHRLKCLYSFGWKLLASSLIHTIYTNIRQLIIGKLYTSENLAMFNKGKHFPAIIVNNVNNSIDSVLFPAMSNIQDSKENVKKMMRTSMRVSGYIMWPLMLGLATVSEPLVELLLTEKWLGCVPYLRIFCITEAFQPIHTSNLNAIKAMGRSDMFLKLEVIKKILGIIILLIAMNFGVFAICCSLLVYNIIALLINTWPNRKLLGYTYIAQIKDIFPFIILSIIMCVPVYVLSYLPLHNIVILILQVLAGIIVYIIESIVFKIDTFKFVYEKATDILHIKSKATRD